MFSSNSEVELEPQSPVRWILSEAQTFEKLQRELVLLLDVAEDRVALRMDSPAHGADQLRGVTFAPVLGPCVQQTQSAVIVQEQPGQRLTLLITEAARREVADHVPDVPQALLVTSKLPALVHHVGVVQAER